MNSENHDSYPRVSHPWDTEKWSVEKNRRQNVMQPLYDRLEDPDRIDNIELSEESEKAEALAESLYDQKGSIVEQAYNLFRRRKIAESKAKMDSDVILLILGYTYLEGSTLEWVQTQINWMLDYWDELCSKGDVALDSTGLPKKHTSLIPNYKKVVFDKSLRVHDQRSKNVSELSFLEAARLCHDLKRGTHDGIESSDKRTSADTPDKVLRQALSQELTDMAKNVIEIVKKTSGLGNPLVGLPPVEGEQVRVQVPYDPYGGRRRERPSDEEFEKELKRDEKELKEFREKNADKITPVYTPNLNNFDFDSDQEFEIDMEDDDE